MMQASSSVVLLALLFCWCWLSSTNGRTTGCAGKVFDFEDSSQADCFQTTGPIATALTTEQYKHGSQSLGVTVADSRVLTQPMLRLSTDISRRELKKGGIKLWLYREAKRNGILTVRFEDTRRKKNVSKFDVNLDFKGWRGIWVSYNECRTEKNILNGPNVMVGAVHLDFPAGSDKIYIDLLEMVTKIGKQSRDKIVPPFTRYESLYDTSDFWQQTYKWSQERPSATPTFQQSKIEELTAIEDRLRNWYADKTKATYELTGYKKQRWDALLSDIDASHVEYASLVKVGGIIRSPTLFSRDSTYGKRKAGTLKFGHIFKKLLLPLSLEYYLRTRDVEKLYIVGAISGSLNSRLPNTKEDAIVLIAGNDQDMKNTFRSSFSRTNDVEASLAALNAARLRRIFDVHDYLEDQGWTDGSGIGSLNHEMNKNGAGFVHSMFLLKTALHRDSSRLDKVIKSMKWYTDFGEIYQSTFEFAGSTADRIKTLLLYRLLVILLMPDGAEKIRDIQAFQRWMDNALSINKALGGLIKPDFTGFHHKAFYPSAYVPHALHTASLVYHLLGDSNYQMSSLTIRNVKNALETLNIVAVKYSMPVSVGGRYPSYTRTSFLNIIPAYAHMSESYSNGLFSVSDPGTFTRLLSLGDHEVDEFQGKGNILSGSYYMNSIGSLTVMKEVTELAGMTVGDSPHGNWAKNFAALSIHRRHNWQVSVKGFNNYVWDFESSEKPENAFGLFQSHGALQISESQDSLISQDTSAGWKWSKVPGTTTIDLTLEEMKSGGDSRFYNPEPLVGGLTFQGTSLLANGLFGMNFAQPAYDKPMLKNIDFKFKKSVFFFDNLLVCVGSGITVRDPSKADRKAQTTLFQKIQIDPLTTRIKVNGVERLLGTPFSAPAFTADTTLVDTNGNGFFIPAGTASSLKVEISDQTSRDGRDENDTSGRYSTAWLDHTQSNSHYEFAVIVNSDLRSFDIHALATAQSTANQVYRVLQNSADTHAVKFLLHPNSGTVITPAARIVGYVIFGDNANDLPAGEPVAAVDKPCLLMVEEDHTNIRISVSSPDLGFPIGRLDSAADVTVDGLYNVESKKTTITVTLSYEDGAISLSHASPHGGVHYTPDVRVVSTPLVDGKVRNKVVFKDLTNGFSVEAHFLKLSVSA